MMDRVFPVWTQAIEIIEHRKDQTILTHTNKLNGEIQPISIAGDQTQLKIQNRTRVI